MSTEIDTSPQTRAVALYGEVNEDTASDLISAMLFMNDPIEVEPEEAEPDTIYMARRPFDLYINTPGGSASDMFAIYDVLKKIEKENQVSTYGIGKVMSAGVLILAAGTKGKRHISENCRVMMHMLVLSTILKMK
jgi:ATP-dependent Clp protease protease subunit